MTTILLYLLTGGVCITALFRPWIGVLAYYLLAIMAPQSIWPWIFDGMRISMMVAVATIIGTLAALIMQKLSLAPIKSKQSIALFVILVFALLSHWFSDYTNHPMPGNMIDPANVLSIFVKAILFYFIAIVCIDTKVKLKWMFYMLIVVFIYYTWWANSIYLTGKLWVYNSNGRLSGPPGLYIDENSFAMLFVVGSAFLFYGAFLFSNKMIRYGLWLVLPLLWHAIFLTNSRGGLLAGGCVVLYSAVRSKSKLIGMGLGLAFVIALVWQGKSLLDRAVETKENAAISQEAVVDPRILSWTTGLKIIAENPILGAGFGRFQQASLEISNHHAYVAHNTFLQFSANCGLITGILYLCLFWWVWQGYRKYKTRLSELPKYDFYMVAINTILGALVGFFVSSIFLDLMIYEIFYCCLALFTAWQWCIEKDVTEHELEATNEKN